MKKEFDTARASMLPAPRRPSRDLLGAYVAHLAMTGRRNSSYASAARLFLDRLPDPHVRAAQPLRRRLAADKQSRPFVTFLMTYGFLQPGWDYLVPPTYGLPADRVTEQTRDLIGLFSQAERSMLSGRPASPPSPESPPSGRQRR